MPDCCVLHFIAKKRVTVVEVTLTVNDSDVTDQSNGCNARIVNCE